jgi:hypothetical protein
MHIYNCVTGRLCTTLKSEKLLEDLESVLSSITRLNTKPWATGYGFNVESDGTICYGEYLGKEITWLQNGKCKWYDNGEDIATKFDYVVKL